jgi:hypothetical protein
MIKSEIIGIGKWSTAIIKVECDNCGSEKEMKMKLYTSYGYEMESIFPGNARW